MKRPFYSSILVGLACSLALACSGNVAWATTLNQFNVQFNKDTLTLQLATDKAVAPQAVSPVGGANGQTVILLPNVTLAPTLQQAGQATVLDTQGRFTAKAVSTDKGVQITLSNLQTKALAVAVSQHRSYANTVSTTTQKSNTTHGFDRL
jgi:hypothetical protein